MSARGWAGVVGRYAKLAANAGDGRGLRSFEQTAREWHDDAADLRELAALLDRITPEMPREVELASNKMFSQERRDVIVAASDILAALSRGPAEQRETGR